ncbi:MAG: hypothetical protein JSV62_07205 [Promethearchaeota archaeon]|nr:MAG: hypothetical protein JSV62_07205 [Candidatus Lokiarchaeota archaeon]
MDLRKFLSRFTQLSNVSEYIISQKNFCALEIEDQFGIPHTTLYRHLDHWCEKGYIEKRRNNTSNHNNAHKEFIITNKGLRYFSEFLEEVSNVVKMSTLRYAKEDQEELTSFETI